MDYLQSLLALDGVAISNYELALKSQDKQREAPTLVRLVMGLNAEVEAVATLAAVFASIANALDNDAPSVRPTPRSLVTFMPPDLKLLAATTAQLAEEPLDNNLLKQLQTLSGRFMFAKQLSRAFAAECGIESRKSSVDVLALAHSWRQACRSAIAALRALNRHSPSSTWALQPYVSGRA